jgi:SPP1 family predicted phage head-tail adaptor
MNIGSLRHRINIQTYLKSDTPFDPNTPDVWQTVAALWASIQPLTSKETFQVGQLAMKVSHRITIRYPRSLATVAAGNRVLYGKRVFNLETGILNPDERNILLELLVYEIDPIQ